MVSGRPDRHDNNMFWSEQLGYSREGLKRGPTTLSALLDDLLAGQEGGDLHRHRTP